MELLQIQIQPRDRMSTPFLNLFFPMRCIGDGYVIFRLHRISPSAEMRVFSRIPITSCDHSGWRFRSMQNPSFRIRYCEGIIVSVAAFRMSSSRWHPSIDSILDQCVILMKKATALSSPWLLLYPIGNRYY